MVDACVTPRVNAPSPLDVHSAVDPWRTQVRWWMSLPVRKQLRLQSAEPRKGTPRRKRSQEGHSVGNKLQQLLHQTQNLAAASSDDALVLRQVVGGSSRTSLRCVAPRKRRGPVEKIYSLFSIDMGPA